jgi:hypothetical protein
MDYKDVAYGIKRHFQQYFSYILAVSFIGGGNRSTRRKPTTCRKSLTNFITIQKKTIVTFLKGNICTMYMELAFVAYL